MAERISYHDGSLDAPEIADAIGHLIARADDQYRGLPGRALPQPFQEAEAIHPGQPEVEDHQIMFLQSECRFGLPAIIHGIDDVAFARERGRQSLADLSIVFDDQQTHVRTPPE